MIPPRLRRGDPVGKLVDHWNMLIDHLNEIRLVAGYGISINKMAAGTIIKVLHNRGNSGQSSIISGGTGPFAVDILNTGNEENPALKAVLHNSSSAESKTAGLLTIGSYRESVPKQEFDPVSGTLFLDVVFDDKTEKYTCKFALQAKLPDTSDQKRYIYRIAEIQYNSETQKYVAVQIHPYGDIEVSGRWVK